MDVIQIVKGDPRYPVGLDNSPVLSAIGNAELLNRLNETSLGLFCSLKCPGSIILKTHDLAQELRAQGAEVIGGFHSPVEKECLRVLLRGHGPLIVCPARSIDLMRVPTAYKKSLDAGRMLILSPFAAHEPRITAKTADVRNRFVTALAGQVFIAFAESSGRTEQLCHDLVVQGKPVYTFRDEETANLRAMGAHVREAAV
jgi:predicted Rossmann fold nucleotide-binding protein DprA/Smf involved in DNA uptake